MKTQLLALNRVLKVVPHLVASLQEPFFGDVIAPVHLFEEGVDHYVGR